MGTKRALRYAASWLSRSADVRVAHVELLRDGVPIPARIVHPDRSRSALPAWILLHGITRPGFDHPQLTRFSRALAATGAVVLIPEISEWRDLELAPEAAVPTVDAALESLASLPDLSEGPYGLMGFSFGGPQALVASADERLAGRLAGVVSFGGYCSLERTIRFQLTGAHEWQGRTQHLRPDPYGRWIIGSNYLTAIPNHADAHDVADSLRRLAATAGDSQVPSWEPVWDELKEQLRSRLPAHHRNLFDVFAPPAASDPDPTAAAGFVDPLAAAARRRNPLMDPAPRLGLVRQRVEILHGRQDRLIPYTESLRMARRLNEDVSVGVAVTRLFGHSSGESVPIPQWPMEIARFGAALRRVLGIV